MVSGAPLEDARHLAQRYSRMRQEAEVQVRIALNILMFFLKNIDINVVQDQKL